jgi:hypothetical protein
MVTIPRCLDHVSACRSDCRRGCHTDLAVPQGAGQFFYRHSRTALDGRTGHATRMGTSHALGNLVRRAKATANDDRFIRNPICHRLISSSFPDAVSNGILSGLPNTSF